MTRPQTREFFHLIFATLGGEIRGFICRWFPSTCRHQIGGLR